MFNRDKLTESFGKESLGTPMKIVVLVSSAHLPMRARGIVRSILGNQEILESSRTDIAMPHVVITDILVRELGFLSVLKNRKKNENDQIINKVTSPLKALQLRLEAESARAKLTYVREFYTLGAMNRLRKSKPDLIIDISDGEALHPVVRNEARYGVLLIETMKSQNSITLQSLLTKELREPLLTKKIEYDADEKTLLAMKRTILLESIILLSAKTD